MGKITFVPVGGLANRMPKEQDNGNTPHYKPVMLAIPIQEIYQ